MQEWKLILVIALQAHHTVSVTLFFISHITSNSYLMPQLSHDRDHCTAFS